MVIIKRRTFLQGLALMAVAPLSSVFLTTPAFACTTSDVVNCAPDPAYQAAAGLADEQAFSYSSNSPLDLAATAFAIPIEYQLIDGDLTTTKKCTTWVTPNASYDKVSHSGSTYEAGDTYTRTDCPADVIYSTTVEVKITDYGVGYNATKSTGWASGSSTGAAPAYARTAQTVPLYDFPDGYYGYGSTIVWEYHAHQEYTKKSKVPRLDSCYEYQADWGHDIEGSPIACK